MAAQKTRMAMAQQDRNPEQLQEMQKHLNQTIEHFCAMACSIAMGTGNTSTVGNSNSPGGSPASTTTSNAAAPPAVPEVPNENRELKENNTAQNAVVTIAPVAVKPAPD